MVQVFYSNPGDVRRLHMQEFATNDAALYFLRIALRNKDIDPSNWQFVDATGKPRVSRQK